MEPKFGIFQSVNASIYDDNASETCHTGTLQCFFITGYCKLYVFSEYHDRKRCKLNSYLPGMLYCIEEEDALLGGKQMWRQKQFKVLKTKVNILETMV